MNDFSVEPRQDNDKRWPPLFYLLAWPIYLVYKVLVLTVRFQGFLVEKQCWLLGIDATVELRESKYWKWLENMSLPLPTLEVRWWNRDK